jgi:hypothetical protein
LLTGPARLSMALYRRNAPMKKQSESLISMVQECTDSYQFNKRPDGSAQVSIVIPGRFADLWAAKLSGLQTSQTEIADYEATGNR